MRDGLSLIGLDLFKEDDHYKIVDLYATCLNLTYVGVKHIKSNTTTNYEFSNLSTFLKRTGFCIKESVRIAYQFE